MSENHNNKKKLLIVNRTGKIEDTEISYDGKKLEHVTNVVITMDAKTRTVEATLTMINIDTIIDIHNAKFKEEIE